MCFGEVFVRKLTHYPATTSVRDSEPRASVRNVRVSNPSGISPVMAVRSPVWLVCMSRGKRKIVWVTASD